jgi:hypothetical protein
VRYFYAPGSEAAHAREVAPFAPAPPPAFEVLQRADATQGDVPRSEWPSVAVRLQESGVPHVRVTKSVACELATMMLRETVCVRFGGALGVMGGYFAWQDGRADGGRLVAPAISPELSHARLEVILGLADPPPPPDTCEICTRPSVKVKANGALYAHKTLLGKPCPIGFSDPRPAPVR